MLYPRQLYYKTKEKTMEDKWNARMDETLQNYFDRDVAKGFKLGLARVHEQAAKAADETNADKIVSRLAKVMKLVEMYTVGSDTISPKLSPETNMKHAQRALFIYHFASAIPSMDAINMIVEKVNTGTVLELCAGRGLWSFFLRTLKINIVAVHPAHMALKDTYTSVEGVDIKPYFAENIRKFEFLLLVRPDIYEPSMETVISCLLSFKGFYVIYVGSETDMANEKNEDGSPKYTSVFQVLEDRFEMYEMCEIPVWYNAPSDYVMFYKKKTV